MNTTIHAEKRRLVDYRQFRFSKLNTPEFEHLKYLLFWPVYGLLFLTVERLWIRDSYAPVHCALDDAIPFCEIFLIPYLFWFVFLVGMLLYTLLLDTRAFKGMMRFIIVSYSAAILIYMLFPNCQQLRPPAFERDNVLTRFIARFYEFDTNTNVCPSIHVIGSAAVMFAAWDSRDFPGLAGGLLRHGRADLRLHGLYQTALRPGSAGGRARLRPGVHFRLRKKEGGGGASAHVKNGISGENAGSHRFFHARILTEIRDFSHFRLFYSAGCAMMRYKETRFA